MRGRKRKKEGVKNEAHFFNDRMTDTPPLFTVVVGQNRNKKKKEGKNPQERKKKGGGRGKTLVTSPK